MKKVVDAIRNGFPVTLVGFCTLAYAMDFSRYQVILDRKPFGEVQIPKEVVQPATAPPSTLTKTLRMCAITEDQDGRVQVGILDLGAKPPQSYFLSVGESQDGIELVDASYEEEKAVVRKGGEECTLQLESGAALSASGVAGGGLGALLQPAPATSVTPPAILSISPPMRRTPSPDGSSSPGTMSGRTGASATVGAHPGSTATTSTDATQPYAERLRARREALRQRMVEGPRLSGEELKKHLEEYQMELIRAKGAMGPPLPIQLTPEMDAQLVAEGVLPPNPNQ